MRVTQLDLRYSIYWGSISRSWSWGVVEQVRKRCEPMTERAKIPAGGAVVSGVAVREDGRSQDDVLLYGKLVAVLRHLPSATPPIGWKDS